MVTLTSAATQSFCSEWSIFVINSKSYPAADISYISFLCFLLAPSGNGNIFAAAKSDPFFHFEYISKINDIALMYSGKIQGT